MEDYEYVLYSAEHMHYIIVAEDEEGYYESPVEMFPTLEAAREWMRENDAEFGSYSIYKVDVKPV